MRYGEQTIVLGVGDCAYFDSALPRQFRRLGDGFCEVVVVTRMSYTRRQ
jgi:hypothetical protein